MATHPLGLPLVLSPVCATGNQHNCGERLRNVPSWLSRCTDDVPRAGEVGCTRVVESLLPWPCTRMLFPAGVGLGPHSQIPSSGHLLSLLMVRGDAQHPEQSAHPVPSPGELSTARGLWTVRRSQQLSRAQQRLLTREERCFPDLCTSHQGQFGRASQCQGCRGTRVTEAASTWPVSARCLSPVPPVPPTARGAGCWSHLAPPASGSDIYPACSLTRGDGQLAAPARPAGRRAFASCYF